MIGLGGRLYYSTDGTTYNELVKVTKTGPPARGKAEQIEETPLNPTQRRREYVPGLLDTEIFTFTQTWTKDRYNALLPYITNGTTLYWRVVAPDNTNPALASRWDFQGNLEMWEAPAMEASVSMVINAEVRITGPVVFTQGS